MLRQKKYTKGFSELNKRTYEASHMRQEANRSRRTDNIRNDRNNSNLNYNNTFNDQRQNFQQRSFQKLSGKHNFADIRNQQQINHADNNIGSYSRHQQVSKYSNQRKKTKNKKRILIIVGIIIAIIIAAAIGIYVFASTLTGNMNKDMDNIGLTPTSLDKPFYTVLMGVDSSEERKADGGTDEDYRSDSIMLVRTDLPQKKVTLMSLHRDTEVDMGEYGKQKLNAAHSLGGPKLVISVVEKLAGVKISEYAEINFDAFKAAVDNIGGVEVDVPMRINDVMAGGTVEAGKQILNGEKALILCRARHAYDDYGDGDKFRAANQRVVLSAIAKKLLNSDIGTIAKTATDLSKYIKTSINLNDMIGLAQRMKDIDFEKDVYSAMMPTEGVYEDGVWYEKLDVEKWKKMMERMDKGLPPVEETIIDSATGTVLSKSGESGSTNGSSDSSYSSNVDIKNGTNTSGLASKAQQKISDMGFKISTGNANAQDFTETVIVYNDDNQKSAAEAIKDKLGCGKVIKNNNEYIINSDILIVVGTDFN